jgi:hypothetical protein
MQGIFEYKIRRFTMGFYENFKLVTSDVFKFFLPLVLTFMKEYGPIILEIAFKTIPLIAATLAAETSDDKRKRAFAIIKKEAEERGIEVPDYQIYAAIEVAVADLKKKNNK